MRVSLIFLVWKMHVMHFPYQEASQCARWPASAQRRAAPGARAHARAMSCHAEVVSADTPFDQEHSRCAIRLQVRFFSRFFRRALDVASDLRYASLMRWPAGHRGPEPDIPAQARPTEVARSRRGSDIHLGAAERDCGSERHARGIRAAVGCAGEVAA